MSSVAKTLLALLATLPAAHASTLILGDTSGNARGNNAVDIQSTRPVGQPEIVAAGAESVAVGLDNATEGERSVALGTGNWAGGPYANAAVGIGNETGGHFNSAFGWANVVYPAGVFYEQGAGAFGMNNYVDTGGVASFAFGSINTISVANSTVFGSGITNAISGSTMIGPSNAAKVTILSTGNVGIGLGTASPTQKLDVGGNIRLSGNIINASGNTVTLPSGGGTLVTTSGTQTITGTTTVQGTTTLGGASTAQQLKVDVSTGNVGIGAAPDSSAKLNVSGAAKFGGEVGVGTGASTDGANLRLLASASDAQWNLDNNTGSLRFFTETSPGVGATTRMTVSPAGYVGIGTASPRNTLDVVRYHSLFGATVNVRSFTSTGVQAPATLNLVKSHGSESAPADMGTSPYETVSKISFSGRYQGTERQVAGIYSYVHDTPSGTATQLPGFLAFNVATEAANSSVVPVVMTSTGRVGVMTLDPQATLDVTGTVQISGDMKVKNNAVIRVSPAGDIAMAAEFQSGTNPAN